jgi:hypothetical protein
LYENAIAEAQPDGTVVNLQSCVELMLVVLPAFGVPVCEVATAQPVHPLIAIFLSGRISVGVESVRYAVEYDGVHLCLRVHMYVIDRVLRKAVSALHANSCGRRAQSVERRSAMDSYALA